MPGTAVATPAAMLTPSVVRPLLVVLLVVCGSGACRRPSAAGVELAPERRIRLVAPDSAGTLAVDAAGRLWRGAPGWAEPIDAQSGAAGARIETGDGGAPRLVGTAGGRVYLCTDERLLAADTATGRTVAERRGAGPAALAPAGDYVYLATANGAVFGLDARSLRPAWAWPRRAAAALALAPSPAGDRLFLALADTTRPGAAGTTVLARDAQTGRIAGEFRVEGTVSALAAAPEGWIYAATAGAGAVLALRPAGEGRWQVAWRRSAEALGLDRAPLEVRASPAGERLAVWSAGRAGSVRLLEAQSGEVVAHTDTRSAPLDAALGADGALYLLLPTEIRVYRAAAAR